jgi:hypothetical protein
MDIGFFFNYKNQVVQLPVNPEQLNVKFAGKNKTTEIIQLGDVNILKDRALAEVSVESFFPYADWFPAIRTKGQFKSPEFYKDFFLGIQNSKDYCRFIVSGINLNMLVSVESFEYTHKAGEEEDAYYKLSLKEYRVYSLGTAPLSTLPAMPKSMVKPTTPSSTAKAPVAATKPKSTPPKKTTVSPSKITVGAKVLVSGQAYHDFSGKNVVLGQTYKNEKAVINYINTGGGLPYYVKSDGGLVLGWFPKEGVKLQ